MERCVPVRLLHFSSSFPGRLISPRASDRAPSLLVCFCLSPSDQVPTFSAHPLPVERLPTTTVLPPLALRRVPAFLPPSPTTASPERGNGRFPRPLRRPPPTPDDCFPAITIADAASGSERASASAPAPVAGHVRSGGEVPQHRQPIPLEALVEEHGSLRRTQAPNANVFEHVPHLPRGNRVYGRYRRMESGQASLGTLGYRASDDAENMTRALFLLTPPSRPSLTAQSYNIIGMPPKNTSLSA